MNRDFQKIKPEEVLFFDTESVRNNKELVIDTREYDLYAKKTRNRDTDEYLPHEEIVQDYHEKGALKRVYNRIVTIGVGFIRNDKAYVKSLVGTEEEIIKEFAEISQGFKYICGFNNISFDLPLLVGNGMKYFNIVDILPDKFNPSGKKPWNLNFVIDLLEIFKGTHWVSSSLDELCYHFGIPSPKGDIEGSQVSEEYYSNGIERISKYVKSDTFANIQLFLVMQGKVPMETFEDRDVEVEKTNLLHRVYNTKEITDTDIEELRKIFLVHKPTDEEVEILRDMLYNVYLKTAFDNKDTKKEVKAKQEDINNLFEELCKK